MKNKKGVSIIILLITIFVMIILAGVLISLTLEDDPIGIAKKQVLMSNINAMKERLDETMTSMENADPDFHRENIYAQTKTEKEKYIPKVPADYLDKVLIEAGNIALDKTKLDATEIQVAKEEKVKVKEPYYKPIVPAGFTAMDSIDKWNDGFRIKDARGNIFVWIPVMMLNGNYANGNQTTGSTPLDTPFNKEFGVRDYTKNKVIQSNLSKATSLAAGKIIISDNFSKIVDAGLNYANIIENVEKHGGFYISAYEIGTETVSGISYSSSRPGYTPRTLDNTYKVEGMDTEIRYTSVYTFLPTTSHYDSLYAWIMATGKKPTFAVDVNSTSWGRYRSNIDKTPKATGSNDNFVVANIYDLAGNMWETTQGIAKTGEQINFPKLNRGGSTFEDSPQQAFASNIVSNAQGVAAKGDENLQNNISTTIGGYRAVLYIK